MGSDLVAGSTELGPTTGNTPESAAMSLVTHAAADSSDADQLGRQAPLAGLTGARPHGLNGVNAGPAA